MRLIDADALLIKLREHSVLTGMQSVGMHAMVG